MVWLAMVKGVYMSPDASPEYFDVLTADGALTGRTKLRSEVHRDGTLLRRPVCWPLARGRPHPAMQHGPFHPMLCLAQAIGTERCTCGPSMQTHARSSSSDGQHTKSKSAHPGCQAANIASGPSRRPDVHISILPPF